LIRWFIVGILAVTTIVLLWLGFCNRSIRILCWRNWLRIRRTTLSWRRNSRLLGFGVNWSRRRGFLLVVYRRPHRSVVGELLTIILNSGSLISDGRTGL